MFVPVWLIFLMSGTIMAVLAIVWGIRHKQFDEQKRARFIPLMGLSAEELADKPPVQRGATFWGLVVVIVSGLVVMALTAAAVIRHL